MKCVWGGVVVVILSSTLLLFTTYVRSSSTDPVQTQHEHHVDDEIEEIDEKDEIDSFSEMSSSDKSTSTDDEDGDIAAAAAESEDSNGISEKELAEMKARGDQSFEDNFFNMGHQITDSMKGSVDTAKAQAAFYALRRLIQGQGPRSLVLTTDQKPLCGKFDKPLQDVSHSGCYAEFKACSSDPWILFKHEDNHCFSYFANFCHCSKRYGLTTFTDCVIKTRKLDDVKGWPPDVQLKIGYCELAGWVYMLLVWAAVMLVSVGVRVALWVRSKFFF
eukprot:Filipodium_phascolosomae@DN4859_c0_g1_i1.p1